MKTCPECKELSQPGATICWRCGQSFGPDILKWIAAIFVAGVLAIIVIGTQ